MLHSVVGNDERQDIQRATQGDGGEYPVFLEDRVNAEDLRKELTQRTTNKLYDIFLKRGIQPATPNHAVSPKRKRSPTEPMVCGTPLKRPTTTDSSPALRQRVMSCSNLAARKVKGSSIKARSRAHSVGQKSIKEMFLKKCDKPEDSN